MSDSSNMDERGKDPLERVDRVRSNFIRQLVQQPDQAVSTAATRLAPPPKRIVQFWDDPSNLPRDVRKCMDSWKRLEQSGFEVKIFDESAARDFIRHNLGQRYEDAFDKCYHPSMKSDYFRYSYIYIEGGFYIDADDVFHGKVIDHLFDDGRLKLQPFCYDIASSQMVSPAVFLNRGANSLYWIFYFNTTPLIAGSNHPIVERALFNATSALEEPSADVLPEVQATTGPGNLTKSIVELISDQRNWHENFVVLHDWESISTSKWPLSYRDDKRNWRLSNQQEYRASRNNEER